MDSTPITINSPHQLDSRDCAPSKQQRTRRSLCGPNTSGTPWIRAILCILLIIAALVVWSVFTSRLGYTLVELITTLRLGVLAQRRVEAALRMLQGVVLAVTCAVVGLVVVVVVARAVTDHKRQAGSDKRTHGRGLWTAFRMTKAVLLVLLWLLMAGLIFIGMLYFASGAALYAAQSGSLGAQSALQQLTVTANTRIDNAEELVADMANTFLKWGEQAPEDVTKTSWFQNLQKDMGPKLEAARGLTEQPSAEQCPSTCLDLRVLTVFLDDRSAQSCVCGTGKLQQLGDMLQRAWRNALVAWCALMVLTAACSWLLMLGVSGYTRDGLQRDVHRNSTSKAIAGAPLSNGIGQPAAQYTGTDGRSYNKQQSRADGTVDGGRLKDQGTPPATPAAAAGDAEQGVRL